MIQFNRSREPTLSIITLLRTLTGFMRDRIVDHRGANELCKTRSAHTPVGIYLQTMAMDADLATGDLYITFNQVEMNLKGIRLRADRLLEVFQG